MLKQVHFEAAVAGNGAHQLVNAQFISTDTRN